MTRKEKIEELMKSYKETYGTKRFTDNYNYYYDKAVEEAEMTGY